MSFLNDIACIIFHQSLMDTEVMPLQHARVLLFEDEPLIALDVEELCLEHGASEVIVVRRLEDAETVELAAFDVAIVDLILGKYSTVTIATALRDAGVPFIFSSGYADAPELAADFPDVRLLAKPYAGEALIGALTAAMTVRQLGNV